MTTPRRRPKRRASSDQEAVGQSQAGSAVGSSNPGLDAFPAFASSDDQDSSEEAPAELDDDSDDVDWEDVQMQASHSAPNESSGLASDAGEEEGDLHIHMETASRSDLAIGKPGGSSTAHTERERHIRRCVNVIHIQTLVLHGRCRNSWLNSSKVQTTVRHLAEADIGRVLNLLKPKQKSTRLEPGAALGPGLAGARTKRRRRTREADASASRADASSASIYDTIPSDTLWAVLRHTMSWFHQRFRVTHNGLRKLGYRPLAQLKLDGSVEDSLLHSQRLHDSEEFAAAAETMQGSRDFGAQLYTALLRSLGFDARLVFSLQPLSHSFARSEDFDPELLTEGDKARRSMRNDRDLKTPIFWSEVWMPGDKGAEEGQWVPVDAVVLDIAAVNRSLIQQFKPRDTLADTVKLGMGIVIAYDADNSLKDVSLRYLRTLRTERVKRLRPVVRDRDPLKRILRMHAREFRTKRDIEEDTMLVVLQQNKNEDPQSLADYKNHPDYVLERHLLREEALRPGARHVRTHGKQNERVYLRRDVIACRTPETWYKEGRVVREGEQPMKQVKARAVTLQRRREHEQHQLEEGTAMLTNLYSFEQTELYVPPPVRDGIIETGPYGNVDCFVPSMVPAGAVHLPYRRIGRVAKQLDISYADAITHFEYRRQRAIPVATGIIVAKEYADTVLAAWHEAQAAEAAAEYARQEARVLGQWRRLYQALRIRAHVTREYK